MTGRELTKLMKTNGWILDRISGSHYIMVKAGKRSIPVPVHGKKDIPTGSLEPVGLTPHGSIFALFPYCCVAKILT